MSDNMPAKFITVWPWHHDEPAFYILCKVNANSNKLLEKFECHSSFQLTMTTFFEIAVCSSLSEMKNKILPTGL